MTLIDKKNQVDLWLSKINHYFNFCSNSNKKVLLLDSPKREIKSYSSRYITFSETTNTYEDLIFLDVKRTTFIEMNQKLVL